MPKRPLVYVIVLTYNCCQQARRCLQSLAELTYDNCRVLVVDNNSADEIAEIVQTEFPNFLFIQSDANLGYTGGNNIGISYALSQAADYVLVLNPDTFVLNTNFLLEMVSYCEAYPQVGIAGPRVYWRTPDTVQNTVLYAPGLWRNLANWVGYRLQPLKYQLSQDQALEAEVLNGVCVLLRADCLKEIGLFDENIFMYIEDADLDQRARQAGWQVKYLPIDSVVHEQKLEGYEMTSMASFLLKRNSVYYLCKIGKRFEAWGYATLSLLLLLARACLTGKMIACRGHLGFARRLALAYREILLRKSLGTAFGPPFFSSR